MLNLFIVKEHIQNAVVRYIIENLERKTVNN